MRASADTGAIADGRVKNDTLLRIKWKEFLAFPDYGPWPRTSWA